MEPSQLLSAFGLLVGTVDYTLLVRRREDARRRRDEEAAHRSGLQGLVRVLLVDQDRPD
jgi:hypothetical protein